MHFNFSSEFGSFQVFWRHNTINVLSVMKSLWVTFPHGRQKWIYLCEHIASACTHTFDYDYNRLWFQYTFSNLRHIMSAWISINLCLFFFYDGPMCDVCKSCITAAHEMCTCAGFFSSWFLSHEKPNRISLAQSKRRNAQLMKAKRVIR